LNGGGSYTETQQQQASGQNSGISSISPYVNLSASWQIGQKSSITASYSHEITPSDYAGSNGQISDRISLNGGYQVSSQLFTHLQVSYSSNDTTGALTYTHNTPSYTETVYAIDAGASYNFVKYFSLTFDISESGVSSVAGIPNSNYNRSQASFGIRGTY
jgi:hypothetical protein